MLRRYLSKKSRVFNGFFYAAAGTFLVSTNFVTAKYSLYGFDPVSFGAVWTLAASFHSIVIIMLTGKTGKILPPGPDRAGLVFLGAATGLGMIWGWTALSMLAPSFNAFLARFAPVLAVILGAVFLGEKITLKETAAIAVMLAGGIISASSNWEIVAAGVFFAFLGFVMQAVQHLIAKTKVRSVHVSVIVFYRSLTAFFVILGWGLIRGELNFSVPGRFWASAGFGALLGPCLSHILYYKSFSYWELSRSSLVSNIQPVFVILLAFLFLKALPDKTQLTGGFVILAGIIWLSILHRNIRPQPET